MGITQKSLTLTLRRLERPGINARLEIPGSPVAVEYRIAPLGETLITPFQALVEWASIHKQEIETVPQQFDGVSDEREMPNRSRKHEPEAIIAYDWCPCSALRAAGDWCQ